MDFLFDYDCYCTPKNADAGEDYSYTPSSFKGEEESYKFVNYDIAPTPLYRFIQSRQWSRVVDACDNDPMQARIWIYRMESGSTRLRWKLLPLHAAIIFDSPADVVSKLLSSYPDAIKKKDDRGFLPLHLAYQKNSPGNVLTVLRKAYPEAMSARDKSGQLPIPPADGENGSQWWADNIESDDPSNRSVGGNTDEGNTVDDSRSCEVTTNSISDNVTYSQYSVNDSIANRRSEDDEYSFASVFSDLPSDDSDSDCSVSTTSSGWHAADVPVSDGKQISTKKSYRNYFETDSVPGYDGTSSVSTYETENTDFVIDVTKMMGSLWGQASDSPKKRSTSRRA